MYCNDETTDYVVGVGMVMRKLGGATKPTVEISIIDDIWTIKTSTTFNSATLTYKLGEMFDNVTADGRKVKVSVG